jgi:RimJ/RimL family protein N-acetyltransferase
MDLRFHSGLEVTVRPIRPDDKELLVAGLRLLSPETVHRRFLAPKPRFSAGELRYLTEVDGHDHVALVAVESERPTHIVAVGRFVRDRERPDTAEFAIVVGDRYQRQGVGRALSRLLVKEARDRGIRRFTATALSDNVAVDRLIASMARQLEYVPAGNGAREIVAELAA